MTESKDRLNSEDLVKLAPKHRFKYILEKSTIVAIGSLLGLLSGLATSAVALTDAIEKLKSYFGLKSSSIDLLVSSAYAATEPLQIPAFSGILKSSILAGIFILLFVLFIWALVTLYKSPNPKAVDVASEAVKMLSGFFIGALTGFLGA